MTYWRISALILGLTGAMTFGHAGPVAAQDINLSIGGPGFVFSFNVDDVAFAYADGYWDHDRRWHRWHDEHERDEFHARYGERYDARFHNRVENDGWREARREEHEERAERHEEHHDRGRHEGRDRDD